jgi:hypothetical protein
VGHKDLLYMTSPEGYHPFKLISARNALCSRVLADLADEGYLRQVDYAASRGLRTRLAPDLADQEYLRHVDYAASRAMRTLLARGSELWMRSISPGADEPFNRSL